MKMIMNETPKNSRGWQIMRRILIALAMLVTLIAILYAEEDWRGKRAWENCKRELEAKGMVLDWDKFIPPPVPDDQNFFTASSNILLRFHKAQTPEQSGAAAQLSWLRIDYSTNAFPILDTAKTGPLTVAKIIILPQATGSIEPGASNLVWKLNDPATPGRVQMVIRTTIGQSVNGAAGFKFSELQLSNLAPAQILLQADTVPSVTDLQSLVPEDLATNIGHLRIEATGDRKSFQVLATGVHVTAAAADYLKWSDQFVPALDEVREALKRPYAIIPGDYSRPEPIPIPNFVTMRALAQTLAQRAQCEFLLGQPDKALRELTLMHDLCRILEKPPTGKPETLVESMINVAITGLYVNTIAEGFHLHVWQEPQLVALQEQLKGISLPPWVAESFREELAWATYLFESNPPRKLADMVSNSDPSYKPPTTWSLLKEPLYLYLEFAPRGWMYQSLVKLARLEPRPVEGFDVEHGTISPRVFSEAAGNVDKFFAHPSPFKTLVRIGIPNFTRAAQTTAYNQTLVNEAQIVCALERFRLAYGNYPETLDALVPQFIGKLPHDIIGGQPLHYRRTDPPSPGSGTASGKFLLYSIGWNETDDGGEPGTLSDPKQGDWVWQYPLK
jgi:hypothetical protein